MSMQPMSGVRVVEVAQFTFVPAAGAILADWGADVVKIEHAEHGDAQRGTTQLGPVPLPPGSFNPLMEHANRGKRSIGLALEHPRARDVLHQLVRSSDVFLTNFLPDARQRLGIETDDIRAVNPTIIYVRGSAFGNRGPDRTRGGYDITGYWCRGGGAAGATPKGSDQLIGMPAPAYGDSIGGMTIAGGISAALFARSQTGEGCVVDVSLLGVGTWANGLAVDLSLQNGAPWKVPKTTGARAAPSNPLSGNFQTADGEWIVLHLNQLWRWWEDFWQHLGRPEVVSDPRYATREQVAERSGEVAQLVADEIRARPLAHWVERFDGMEGAWAAAQDSVAVGRDRQVRANGYVVPVVDADGTERELVANPVQFDETPPSISRAPRFAEHTDEVLRQVGFDDDEIIDLKISGAVT
jgi:crotonobetainyl-CoA:carnitine CoA-transferase CaiB-like acyl-CoA transferase